MMLEELIRRTKEFEGYFTMRNIHTALGYMSLNEYYNEAAVYQKCV